MNNSIQVSVSNNSFLSQACRGPNLQQPRWPSAGVAGPAQLRNTSRPAPAYPEKFVSGFGLWSLFCAGRVALAKVG